MIAVISNHAREASALAKLVDATGRPVSEYTSLQQFKKLLRKIQPTLVITRLRLADGYSDDVFALLSKSEHAVRAQVIVLAGADCTPKQEARQLALGADCVLRDPLRPEVLLGYATKFLNRPRVASTEANPASGFPLAGATISPEQHELRRGKKSVHLTPKEIELARLLSESPGKMLTYEILYTELFVRKFSGDTSNLRVLLGKLASSFKRLRLDLRTAVEVMPKSGCRYSPSRN